MTDRFTTFGGKAVELPPVIAIRPEAGPPIPRAAPRGDPAVRTAQVNAANNGRLPWAAEFGSLAVAWSAPLLPLMRPAALLWWRDRVVVQGETSWQLFALNGAPLRMGHLGDSGIAIDPLREVFYSATSGGLIAARRLRDGRDAFVVGLLTGEDHTRTFIASQGDRLLTVSSRFPLVADGTAPESSSVELMDIGPIAAPKSLDGLDEPLPVGMLTRPGALAVAAMHGGTLTLATIDRLYRLDSDLRIRQALSGTFTPQALSSDEEGRSYLVVTAAGGPSLWLIAPTGERRYAFAIPTSAGALRQPPVIGFDHTAYLVHEELILAVASDGRLLWARRNRGRVAGAAVTADDWLLVSDGKELVAYDVEGQRSVLHTFASPLVTAPVLTPSGEYLVATAEELHNLRAIPGEARR